jgi:predicted dehydrogenase
MLAVAALPLLGADLRLGIVGTDTSHVPAFTKMLHDGAISGAKVVAAYKGGSPDFSKSSSRVERFATEISSKYGVEMVDTIAALCPKVDGILLESVDARQHLAQMREIVRCGRPVFVDKPLAASLEDAREIARIAEQARVPWFSASSLRWSEAAEKLKTADATGAITWGPESLEPSWPLDLAWYGIHSIELLYSIMGPGCDQVTRIAGSASDEIVCRWRDGRIGSVRGLAEGGDYGGVVYRADKSVVQSPPKPADPYEPLVREIVRFMQTKQPPVSNAETLEIMAFMDAADRSKKDGGRPVRLR